MENKGEEQKVLSYEESQQIEKKRKKKIALITIFSLIGVSFLLVGLLLLWQDAYDMFAFCNAFYVAGAIMFIFGWMVIMINKNIFSPMIFGLKSFFLMFVGKKQKMDYYQYIEHRKENPLPKFLYAYPMFIAIPNIIVGVILNILL